jgi:cytochrome P450
MSATTTYQAPDHVPAELVRHIDVVADQAVLDDPYGYFDELRSEAPVLYSTALGGFWMVLGAAEVREVFQRADVFNNYPTGVPPMVGFWPRKMIPEELDGAEHRKYRRLLIPFFGPAAIGPILDGVKIRAEELIRGFEQDQVIDFVEAFAKPLPTTVFLELFGLPVELAETFTNWNWDLMHAHDPERSRETAESIVNYLAELIARRRLKPAADLISALIGSKVDESPLSDEDLLDICFLLFIAGMDTVTSQLGVLFLHLATHRELQQEMRANPDGIPTALEELLRAFPIVPPARTVAQEIQLGGAVMHPGDTVLVAVSAATRDRAVHADGEVVRFDRGAAWSAAFGVGPHRCLGVHLARYQLEITLRLMTSLLPPFALAPGAEPQLRTAGNVWGLDHLPIVFDRA